MLSSNKHTNLLTLLAITSGAISAVLRIFGLVFFYDTHIGYYAAGAIIPIAANIFFAVAVLAFALCSVFLLKGIEAVPAPGKASGYAALLPAAAMAVYTVQKLVTVTAVSPNAALNTSELITVILGFVSIAFFLSLLFSKQPSALTVICGTGFIFWIGLAWMRSYTDFFSAMNSPDKIFFHLGCIGAALLTVAELRTAYHISKPKFYYFSLWFSIISLSTASIPAIVANFCKVYAYYPTKSEDIVLLALAIYASVRAFSLLFSGESENEEPALPSEPENEEPALMSESETAEESSDNSTPENIL
jgi:hypothetical protein